MCGASDASALPRNSPLLPLSLPQSPIDFIQLEQRSDKNWHCLIKKEQKSR